MIIKNFEISIAASPVKVWFALWDQHNYRQWTSAFCEGSYYAGELAEGNQIQFLMPKGEGMYSKVSTLVQNEKMYFTHIGEVKNFENLPLDDKSKSWSGARENYTLLEENGGCKLSVELDLVEDHAAYFEQTFPKALEQLKTLAENLKLTIGITVNAPVQEVWNCMVLPEHILKWNHANADWHTTKSENDLRVGGKFVSRMEAKDGSFGFDFGGTYTEVSDLKSYAYVMDDGRRVWVSFEDLGNQTKLIEIFEPEGTHPPEFQQSGWQAILNNLQVYVEKVREGV